MLSKKQRLTTKQFNEVMKNGRIAHSPLFLIRVLKNQPDTRVSAVAPQKVAKNAVIRNVIRRKIYDSVDPLIFSIKNGCWLIFFAKKDIRPKENNSITEELKGFLSSSEFEQLK